MIAIIAAVPAIMFGVDRGREEVHCLLLRRVCS